MGNYGIYNQPSPRTNREIRVIHPANNLGNPSIQRNTLQSSPTSQAAEMFSSPRMANTPEGLRGGSCHLGHQDTKHPGPATLVPGGHPANQPTDPWGCKTCGTQIPPGDTSPKDRPDARCCQARTRRTPAKKEEHFAARHLMHWQLDRRHLIKGHLDPQ